MAEQPVDPQAAATLLDILRDRLADDSKGRDFLARFEQDPQENAEGLADYLRRRLDVDDTFVQALAEAPELPADVRTVVHGGQVERIIQIAQAGTVIVSPPPRERMRLWAGLAALAVVVVIVLVLSVLYPGGDQQSATPTPFLPLWAEPIPAFEGKAVSAIAQNPQNGDLWISVLPGTTPGGVYRYTRGEGLTFFEQGDEIPQADVEAILGRADGEIWLGTYGAGVAVFLAGDETPSTDDDQWQTYTVADGLMGSEVLAIAEDRQGNIWFGTFDGLCLLTPRGEWLYYHPETGWTDDLKALPAENRPIGYAICVDGTGDVWLATSEALLRWPGDDLEGQPTRYRREDTLSEKDKIGAGGFVSLAFDNEGRPWVGTTKGFVSVLERGVETHDESDDHWQTYAIAPKVGTAIVLALLPMPDGRVLAGTTGGGLRVYDPGLVLWKGYPEFGLDVRALFLEEEERLWTGTSQGLFLWDLRSTP